VTTDTVWVRWIFFIQRIIWLEIHV
jgi:hypothetical protein